MGQEADQPSPGAPDPILGMQVFRCRLLSGPEQLRALGHAWPWLDYYVTPLVPIVGLSVPISLASSYPIFQLMPENPAPEHRWFMGIFWLISFGCALALLTWLYFFVPRWNCLVLFENGMHVQKNFRKSRALFNDIQEVIVDPRWESAETLLDVLGDIAKPDPYRPDPRAHQSITVVHRDGTSRWFGVLLLYFEPKDVMTFVKQLSSKVALRKN